LLLEIARTYIERNRKLKSDKFNVEIRYYRSANPLDELRLNFAKKNTKNVEIKKPISQ